MRYIYHPRSCGCRPDTRRVGGRTPDTTSPSAKRPRSTRSRTRHTAWIPCGSRRWADSDRVCSPISQRPAEDPRKTEKPTSAETSDGSREDGSLVRTREDLVTEEDEAQGKADNQTDGAC